MSETIKVGWLKNNEGEKFAPKTLMSQVITNDGVQLNNKIETDLLLLKQEVNDYVDSHINDDNIHITDAERTDWNDAKEHSDSAHARTDATKTESSETNGNILINGVETTVYIHPEGTNPHGTTKDDLGLENVENKSSETIRSEITKENVVNALGYTPPTTDTTYDVAGENLGLVKSGGDLTIVDGVATVNDLDKKVPETRTVNGKALSANITLSSSDVRADALGTASSLVSAHNVDTDSHNDIRDLITSLTDRLNALADSDDDTLDQMSEIVTYIKANKSLIESVTTTKVNVSDIVNNLTTNTESKVLSASQGVAIKALIDALQTEVNLKANSSDLTTHKENATVHITPDERDDWNNAKVHANSTHAPSNAQANVIETVKVNGTALTPDSKAVDITVPTKLSDLENDSEFLTSYTETDPTVPSWAKNPTKPTYTYEEVGADKKGSSDVALVDAKSYTDDKITELSENVVFISEDNEEIGNINTVLTTGDIVDNLNSSSDTMVLSARQGNVLNRRINTMQALPEGSTTADAALYDINIGHDGTDWKSPGDAVRGQISQLSSEIDNNETMIERLSDSISVSKLDNFYKINELMTGVEYSNSFFIWHMPLGGLKTLQPGKYIGICHFNFHSTGENEITSFNGVLGLGRGLDIVNQGTTILSYSTGKHDYGNVKIASIFEITEETNAGLYMRASSIIPADGGKAINFTINRIALLPISDYDDIDRIIESVLAEQLETYFIYHGVTCCEIDDENVNESTTWSSSRIDSELVKVSNNINTIADIATPNLVNIIGTFNDGYQVSIYGDKTTYNASNLSVLEFTTELGKTYTVGYISLNSNMSLGNNKVVNKPNVLAESYDFVELDGSTVTFTITDELMTVLGVSTPPTVRLTVDISKKEKVFLAEGNKYIEESVLNIKVPYIDEKIKNITTDTTIVNCFGDSLTMGTAGGATPFTNKLQELLGESYTVNNFGVGGETAQQIAGRQGGVPIIVQPTFNADYSTWDNINLVSAFGSEIGLLGYQSTVGLYPCTIDGVRVSFYWDSDNKQIARCSNSGDVINVIRPTQLKPYSTNFKKNTLIIWSGTNGWGDNDVNTLVEMQKRMIEYNDNQNYLVIGIHSDNRMDVWEELEKAQTKAFGYHYINIRDYLVKYGLEDCGLEPTEEDLQRIAEGKVPKTLMIDGIHFPTTTNEVIANVIYQRGKEIGLW